MWIDSHCHLNHKNIAEAGEASALVSQAHAAGIDGMITVCCRIEEEFSDLVKIANAHDNVWCSVGTHPHDAGVLAEKSISQEQLVEMALSDPKIVGIGESGLDYYYDNAPREDQQVSFRKHIKACIAADLPLIVHSRDAEEDTAAIIREEGSGGGLNGVMHCFSSGPGLAEAALDFGFYLSFSGIVTFKKAAELQEIAKNTPLDRILVETDAPFLAPEPYRGKTNVPAYVVRTGEFLADLHGISAEEMARITTENFFRLFQKAQLS